jgi:hypothetical protein
VTLEDDVLIGSFLTIKQVGYFQIRKRLKVTCLLLFKIFEILLPTLAGRWGTGAGF